jgi:hypothetical protein
VNITIINITNEILKYEKTDMGFSELLDRLRTVLMDLEAHIGGKIEIGNNAYVPLNEKRYVLSGYSCYKVFDGTWQKKYSIMLVITVQDDNMESISFCYNLISSISYQMIKTDAVKYYISVRNKVFDHQYNPDSELEIYNKDSDKIKDFIDSNLYSSYRFTLHY